MRRERLTFANVVAVLALVIALAGTGGVAYAHGMIGSADIKNGAVKTQHLAKGAVSTRKVKKGAIKRGKISNRAVNRAKLAPRARVHWAVVDAQGNLTRSSGGVSAARMGGNDGQYEVFFPIRVDNCAFIATVGSTTTGIWVNGSATSAPRFNQPNGVVVVTSSNSESFVDRPFHLAVHC